MQKIGSGARLTTILLNYSKSYFANKCLLKLMLYCRYDSTFNRLIWHSKANVLVFSISCFGVFVVSRTYI